MSAITAWCRVMTRFVALVSLLSLFTAGGRSFGAQCPADAFALWNTGILRGANVFQGRNPGGATNGFGDGDFTQADFDDLARAGANYVQISHAGTFAEQPPYALDPAAEANLDHVIEMAGAAGLYAVIAFRSGPGRNENAISNRDVTPLDLIWSVQGAHDAWVAMLRHTAERYGSNPVVVGYDVMVEPNAYALPGNDFADPIPFYIDKANMGTLADVNVLHRDATAAIRQVDTETPILLEPDGFANITWLPFLTDTGDARTVYTTHDYTPFEYTHEVTPGATYPGSYDVDGDMQNELVNQAFLATFLAAIQAFSDQHGVPVAITEFGVHRTAPNAATYLSDRIGIQDTIGSWAVWTWQPLNFIDPFNMHDPSAVNEVLRTAWASNCTRLENPGGGGGGGGGGVTGNGSITGRVWQLKKNGNVGAALLKVKVSADAVSTTTKKKPKKGTYTLAVTAGAHNVTVAAGRKKLCHVGAVDGPETLSVSVANGETRTVNVFCAKRKRG